MTLFTVFLAVLSFFAAVLAVLGIGCVIAAIVNKWWGLLPVDLAGVAFLGFLSWRFADCAGFV